MNITLRQAAAADRPFAKSTYFETTRWIVEELFGSDDADETTKFEDFYREDSTQIIMVDDNEAGFMTLLRRRTYTEIQCLFLLPGYQNRGIGTHLLQELIAQADADGTRLAIGTYPINPAQRLYRRLGFVVAYETQYRIEFMYPDTD